MSILFLGSCSKKVSYLLIHDKISLDSLGTAITAESEGDLVYPCDSNEYYIPERDDPLHKKTRTLRLIFHIMNAADSSKNFLPHKAPGYFWTMLNNAQDRISENRKMNLPEGNETPVLFPNYRYKKVTVPEDADGDGLLYHYDDDLYYFLNRGRYRNNYKRDVIEKYSVGGDSILNIFVMPHHPDSVASTTYKAHSSGIALGNNIKIAGIYENGGESWQYATLLNHEIGHVLGLKHSWIKRDGCDDTPPHGNCYDSFGDPPCDGLASNNMMDYNNSQMAITPCQLGIIHQNFSNIDSRQRKILVKDWCRKDTSLTIKITGTAEWKGDIDNAHDIDVMPGAELTIYCRLSMPQGGRIKVHPGGKLNVYGRIHSDCGGFWGGIHILKEGKKMGSVIYNEKATIENVKFDYPGI